MDVGCGSGQGTELLAPYFLTVVGIDISRAQLATADAEEHAPNVCYRYKTHYYSNNINNTLACFVIFIQHCLAICFSIRESPAEDLPFEDESTDLVTSFSAAHWFDHPRFLREADRILRPGGCLALLSYTMDFELEYGDKTPKLNEICQEVKKP